MKTTATILGLALLAASSSCAKEETNVAQPPTAEQTNDVNETISAAVKKDPSLQRFLDGSYGYIVFPNAGRGAFIVGGTHGTGWVYEQGRLVGKSALTRASVGAQVGGESFAELIFFKDKNSMNVYKTGSFKLGAGASAVMVKSGAATSVGYTPEGLAVFTIPKGGALVAASVGGQTLSYEPLSRPIAVPAAGAPVAREVKPAESAAPPAPTAPPSTGVATDDEILTKCQLKNGKKFFEFDKSNLNACDLTTINNIAGCLSSGPLKGMKLEIVGFADPRGTDEYNQKLGESRAQAVADYLAKMGVSKDQLSTSSKGKSEATGTDENGWVYDRRVELHLVRPAK
jgi:outer membrane protein OmpA-like peptidoglycan-associated protein